MENLLYLFYTFPAHFTKNPSNPFSAASSVLFEGSSSSDQVVLACKFRPTVSENFSYHPVSRMADIDISPVSGDPFAIFSTCSCQETLRS